MDCGARLVTGKAGMPTQSSGTQNCRPNWMRRRSKFDSSKLNVDLPDDAKVCACSAAAEAASEKYLWNERVGSSVAGEVSAAASHESHHLAVAIVWAESGTGDNCKTSKRVRTLAKKHQTMWPNSWLGIYRPIGCPNDRIPTLATRM